MSNPAAPTARRGAPRPSVSATVLQVAAVAAIAAVLIWSVLFADLLRKHGNPGTALNQPAGQLASPDSGQPAQPPAPVTTRTS
jgi:hypothetical protein